MFRSELQTSDDRFTRFLCPFRREGERPRKAFYLPTQRASSLHRSSKIEDANDMITEATEKGQDLSQSSSSAATSIESGVKYCLDLDLEGHLLGRFGGVAGNNAAWQGFQLHGSGRLYLRRKNT